MTIAERFAGALLLLTLSACHAPFPTEKGLPTQYRPAWSILNPDEEPPMGLGAYAYLVLTSRPGNAGEKHRYHIACAAMHDVLPAEDTYRSTASTTLMVTYWPLAHTDHRSASDIPCDDLVDIYNYPMAASIVTAVNAGGVRGPLLAAWTMPFTDTAPTEPGLLVDLSRFSDDDLKRALLQWRARLARNPAAWKQGLAVERFREELRNFVILYGDSIVSVIKPRS